MEGSKKNKIIECQNIKKIYKIPKFISFSEIYALKKVNFFICNNEIFSIIGLNGAGKSTLLSIILGITRPTNGKIRFNLKDYKSKIGYMLEIVNFPLNLTPVDILTSMKNIFPEITNDKINEVLDLVGLKDSKNNKLKTFSKGMLQRFNLAQAIIHNPEILILDEPFSGLDPLGRKLFFDIFLNLKENGKTIIFSSHILTDVEKISDKILILHKGVSLEIISPESLKEKSLHDYFIKKISENESN